jgi:hypothetical protein
MHAIILESKILKLLYKSSTYIKGNKNIVFCIYLLIISIKINFYYKINNYYLN